MVFENISVIFFRKGKKNGFQAMLLTLAKGEESYERSRDFPAQATALQKFALPASCRNKPHRCLREPYKEEGTDLEESD
ncbi:MAG: hypothetical protein APU95_02895 [Hadesarchaea archaeon YNP_N21]|nr:MAG: hypothetical protein APU95_02895 [Hadesarchaea archaeon YNP_N21]